MAIIHGKGGNPSEWEKLTKDTKGQIYCCHVWLTEGKPWVVQCCEFNDVSLMPCQLFLGGAHNKEKLGPNAPSLLVYWGNFIAVSYHQRWIIKVAFAGMLKGEYQYQSKCSTIIPKRGPQTSTNQELFLEDCRRYMTLRGCQTIPDACLV